MSIKAIIFDVGGVLHSSENEHLYQDVKETLKISDQVFGKFYFPLVISVATGQLSEAEFWQEFITLTSAKGKLPKESLFLREYAKRFKAHKEVLALVKKLKQSGYQLAILSDTIDSHYRFNLQQGIYDDFPVRIFSHQVGFKKPQPEIYQLALAKLGIRPEEAVFIDDLDDNVAGATKLGIVGIKFENIDQLIDELKKLAVL